MRPELDRPSDEQEAAMQPRTHIERAEFIRLLALPAPDWRMRDRAAAAALPPPPTITDRAQGAYVAEGSTVSFVAGVSAQHQADILNSTLLAQLAANKKYDREVATREWYDFYKTVL